MKKEKEMVEGRMKKKEKRKKDATRKQSVRWFVVQWKQGREEKQEHNNKTKSPNLAVLLRVA